MVGNERNKNASGAYSTWPEGIVEGPTGDRDKKETRSVDLPDGEILIHSQPTEVSKTGVYSPPELSDADKKNTTGKTKMQIVTGKPSEISINEFDEIKDNRDKKGAINVFNEENEKVQSIGGQEDETILKDYEQR